MRIPPGDAPAGSNRSGYGGNEVVEAFGVKRHDFGDVASVQAVTRVNAEQSSKWKMHRSTRRRFRGRLIRLGDRARRNPGAVPGYWRQHVHEEDARNTGSPKACWILSKPVAREGRAGRLGVTERPAVPVKPGNAGRGKGPQF